MIQALKQLVIASFRDIANSKEFQSQVYEMVYKAVFGTLELIRQLSLFLYKKTIEVGKLIGNKINAFIKRFSR